MNRFILFLLLAVSASVILPSQPEISFLNTKEKELEIVYKSYYNSRYNFCAEYPAEFLFPQTPPENGDGLEFRAKDGKSHMVASGIHLLPEDIKGAMEREYQEALEPDFFRNRSKTTSYKRIGKGFFIVSGYIGENIYYYRRHLVGRVFKSLYFEYPPGLRSRFDTIISHVTRNFPECIDK